MPVETPTRLRIVLMGLLQIIKHSCSYPKLCVFDEFEFKGSPHRACRICAACSRFDPYHTIRVNPWGIEYDEWVGGWSEPYSRSELIYEGLTNDGRHVKPYLIEGHRADTGLLEFGNRA